MKLSILTPTYNDAKGLKEIYDSIVVNLKFDLDFEWIIMDDGSNDNTQELVSSFIENQKFEIRYYKQEHHGISNSINNLMQCVKGDIILECNTNEYLANNAFKIIKEKSQILISDASIYALVFLKCDIYGEVNGNEFKNDYYRSTMFNLYYKEGIEGEKILLYNASIRKAYVHEIERKESYIPRERMQHQMDLKYKVICFNEPMIIGDKTKENIEKRYIENPYGYKKYYKEMLNMDLKEVSLKNRVRMVKQYVLFASLSSTKNILKDLKEPLNKFLVVILFLVMFVSGLNYRRKYNKKLKKNKSQNKK